MYEDVNWDAKLPPRIHAPYTTNEYARADPLKNMDDLYLRPQLHQVGYNCFILFDGEPLGIIVFTVTFSRSHLTSGFFLFFFNFLN